MRKGEGFYSAVSKFIVGLFFIVCFEALYAIAWQTRARFTGDESSIFDPVAIVFVALISFILWKFRRGVERANFCLGGFLSRGSDKQWLIIVLGIGVILRIAYVIIFPASPSSDGANYLSLANDILNGRPYEIAGKYAYWPPGYPLFMAAWLSFLSQKAAVVGSNLFLFFLTGISLYFPLKRFVCPNAARLAIVLFVSWPNLVASSSVPAKENLLIALISLVAWLLVSIRREYSYFLIGLLLGLASLIQPGLLLFWVAVPMSLLTTRRPVKFTFFVTILILVGMTVVISPWMYRNHMILGKAVITTNGGSNFYRVNNPLADGRYQSCGELDYSHLGEVDQSKVYYDAAIGWIKQHPANFVWLGLKKQFLWLGDDGAAFYSSLKMGGGSHSPKTYFVARAIGNVFWLGIWMVLLAVKFIPQDNNSSLLGVFSMLGILYLLGIHTFFESAPKYHMPVSSLIIILAVSLLFSYQDSRSHV